MFTVASTESPHEEEPSDCWDQAFRQRASGTLLSIADLCAEKRTLVSQDILLSQERLIVANPNMRKVLESVAVQRFWVSQQALSRECFMSRTFRCP